MEKFEFISAVLPALGGALALVGGVFAFVNGRLSEAKTAQARERVVSWTLSAISVAFTLLALGIALNFPRAFLTSVGLWGASFAVQLIMFVRSPRPLHRAEVAMFCLACSAFIVAVTTAVTFDVLHRVIDLVGGHTEILKELINMLRR